MKSPNHLILSSPVFLILAFALLAMFGPSGEVAYAAPCCQECESQLADCQSGCSALCGTAQPCLGNCNRSCFEDNMECSEYCVWCSALAMSGSCSEAKEAGSCSAVASQVCSSRK
jgi:hypothetical protein